MSPILRGRGPCSFFIPRLSCSLLVIAMLLGPTSFAAASPEQDLKEAIRAYEQSKFAQVIQLTKPLLYPQIKLSSQRQLILAYKLLGISYLFEKDRIQAEKQLLAILSLRPDFTLDPLVDPPAAVNLLEETKRRNAEKLDAIRERERQEAERRRQAELKQATEQRRALLQQAPHQIIKQTITRNPYWINFIPLGAGQFQNGHRRKGYILFSAQLGLGAVSLATALSLRVAYPDGRVPPGEMDRANALAITQVVSGAFCFGLMAYGIIDALIYHQPQTVTEQHLGQRRISFRSLMPTVGPGSAGLRWSMTY